MIKKLLTFVLLAVGMASAQSHTLPTLDRTNNWTGVNTFIYGDLQLNQGASCPTGQYITGYTNTFAPICNTPGGGSGNIVSINGDTTPAQLIIGAGGITCTTTSGTTTCSYGGSAGSGVVDTANYLQLGAYPATGTTISGAPHAYILNPGMSTSQINTFLGTLTPGSDTVIIPDGTPQQQWSNSSGIRMIDYRSGASMASATQYGIACDAAEYYGTITEGTNTINVGSNLSNAVGETLTISEQTGYGVNGTQATWAPTIASYSYPNITLSSNAPFSFTGWFQAGHDNTTQLQAALNDSSYLFPFTIPAGCGILTQAVTMSSGQSIIGPKMGYGGLVSFPGQDILLGSGGSTGQRIENVSFGVDSTIDATRQYTSYNSAGSATTIQPMNRPIDTQMQDANDPLAPGWAINATNGVASITQGSPVICVPTTLGRVPVVGQQIIFRDTPSIFQTTVISNTGAGCSSGFTGSTMTTAFPNTSGYTIAQAEWVSASSVQSTSTTISGTPTYPFTITLNNSIQPVPGYESNVATHGHIKIGSTEFSYIGVNGYASNVLVIRDGPTSVNSGTGYLGTNAVVPMNPCPATYEVPWPVTPSVNVGAITAWAITSNVVTFTASNNLVAGQVVYLLGFGTSTFFNNQAVTVLSSGLSTSQFEVAFTHANGSATESGSFNNSTPSGAVYFPGLCVGNAAIAYPQSNGYLNASGGAYNSFFNNLFMSPTGGDLSDQNGTAGIYSAGNAAFGYDTTLNQLNVEGLEFGLVQGPAAFGNHGVKLQGPTGTGNSVTNCTIRAAYPLRFVDWGQSNVDRCDTYSTAYNQFDGSAMGGSTWLGLGYVLDEQTGSASTSTFQDTLKDVNEETENGNQDETPVNAEIDCFTCTLNQVTLEGGFNIFGGELNRMAGGYMAPPIINYGSNNTFEGVSGFGITKTSNTWQSNFMNWGPLTTCSGYDAGAGGTTNGAGALLPCGVGLVSPNQGQTVDTILMGQFANPIQNPQSGMITPGEWNTSASLDSFPMTTGFTVDSTEPFWGSYASCNISSGSFCQPNHYSGFAGEIYIGPHQRLQPISYVMEMDLRTVTASTSLTMYIGMFDDGSGSCTAPAANVGSAVLTVTTTWSPFYIPVNMSGRGTCTLSIQFGPSTTSDTLRIGAVNFVPIAQWSLLPVTTVSGACPVNGAILGSDSANMYVCANGEVQNLPFGGGGGGGTTIQTNGTANANQSLLNFTSSGTVTFSNPSGGVESATVPTATSSSLGVSSYDNTTIGATSGVYHIISPGASTVLGFSSTNGYIGYTAGSGISFSGGQISASSTGNLTGTLTATYVPVATGVNTLANSLATDNGTTFTYGGTGGIAVTGTTPGLVEYVAGTGTVSALPANSYGFIGPPASGTPYLLQNPGTATAGFLEYAAPATEYGVNVSQGSFVHTEWNFSSNSFAAGLYSLNTHLADTIAVNAGHGYSLQGQYVASSGCTTPPTVNLLDVTSSATGTALTLITSGTGFISQSETGFAFAAGDHLAIEVTSAGAACTSGSFSLSAQMETP